jgi:pyridoxal phosphate enzyme (YggS family)
MTLRERLSDVEDRIASALARCGRRREEVTLVAVSKTFPAEAIEEAYEIGLRHFGENYVQEFETKHPRLRELPDANFHLIGHLQSNKSRKAAELFQTIETVDSVRLVNRLREHGAKLDVMMEVKLSEEDAKHGAAPEEISDIGAAIAAAPNLKLLGLMTIPPWTEQAEESRPYFVRLRELAQRHGMSGLSMGMSNDFEVAIEEGATHIRVGTALFGSRIRG